ncbi:hypothetical protein DXK93_01190 [Achromobacter sp. K91]|uniref:RHS repeat-associated core domain-containing protein n=1 Tax=Achromobacter sp. K91 TaxID=2292262 RepID=UPI000E668625|nr:RHS repeat-associated core domain-containing protein [Achromobacter sp. K91]RIJ06130.1 hypothetical protein DXK93_01190 [Achromobacter sp. K91]
MGSLCAGTPKITVRDNRGLTVRTLRYNRSAAVEVATQYVDAQDYNDLGQPISSQDARFFAQGSGPLNFQYTPALSGQVLATISVDAGTTQAFADIQGRVVWEQSQGRDCLNQADDQFTTTHQYDALGRPTSRTVAVSPSEGNSTQYQTDIWAYGESQNLPSGDYDQKNIADPRNLNLRGQIFQHYDTAGLLDMSARGYSVLGGALRQDRQTLSLYAAFRGRTYSWTGVWPNVDKGDLDAQFYSTSRTYNALAQMLVQTDAMGHQQQTAYDVAGRKVSSSVTPNGGTNTPVTTGVTYTASGQIETQNDANSVQTAYMYEPQTTQRVLTITTTRSAEATSAAAKCQRGSKNRPTGRSGRRGRATTGTTLQDLTYTYDAVGNVIALSDASTPVAYIHNGAVDGNRSYTYDALYQLLSASGRENYVSSNPSGTDSPIAFSPPNPASYRSYTRNYSYDLGGNLRQIAAKNAAGTGATVPTRNMVVATDSNRALSDVKNSGLTPAGLESFFDGAGQSTFLDGNPNLPMYWTPFHQLYCLVSNYRSSGQDCTDWGASDCELYAYDSEGQRVRKASQAMISGGGISWVDDAIYLPGLEVRFSYYTRERLEVIVLDDGARLLNWTANKPSDIDNQQIRYRYGDRQNSCQIETDDSAQIITQEEYYPYGGTAVWTAASTSEAKYKTIRYSGKERDAAGLYYYGMRYYQPWIGRWINPDPAGTVDGLNLYCMVGNNPVTDEDSYGLTKKGSDGEEADRPEEIFGWEDGKSSPPSGLSLIPNIKDPENLSDDADGPSISLSRYSGVVTSNHYYGKHKEATFNATRYFDGKITFGFEKTKDKFLQERTPALVTIKFKDIKIKTDIVPPTHAAFAYWADYAKNSGLKFEYEPDFSQSRVLLKIQEFKEKNVLASTSTSHFLYPGMRPVIKVNKKFDYSKSDFSDAIKAMDPMLHSVEQPLQRNMLKSQAKRLGDLLVFRSIVHEIGHVLGFSHPFDVNAEHAKKRVEKIYKNKANQVVLTTGTVSCGSVNYDFRSYATDGCPIMGYTNMNLEYSAKLAIQLGEPLGYKHIQPSQAEVDTLRRNLRRT